ncbi:MAG: pyridoxal-phosphate dependent enzyme, partial [Chloroflexi bacterium]|nr:pyridoxal-phosphate dependent enzyme [Chloroflexota bacterium]
MPRLAAHLGGPPIFVKRDDLSGLAAGGNKARKLQALLPDAVAKGATVVLTQGGPQSNHCSQTALAAAMFGLRCELFIWGDEPSERTGNLRVEDLVDAMFHYVGATTADVDGLVGARARELQARGERPY